MKSELMLVLCLFFATTLAAELPSVGNGRGLAPNATTINPTSATELPTTAPTTNGPTTTENPDDRFERFHKEVEDKLDDLEKAVDALMVRARQAKVDKDKVAKEQIKKEVNELETRVYDIRDNVNAERRQKHNKDSQKWFIEKAEQIISLLLRHLREIRNL